MSVHEKSSFWNQQFEIALPYKMAVHFVLNNRDRIERDFLAIDTEKAAHWTRGRYGRSDIGGYVVRVSGYVQEILQRLIANQSPTSFEQMLLGVLNTNPPNASYKYWRDLKSHDPEHPALNGEVWCHELATELGEVIGEYLAGSKLNPAVHTKFNEMQSSSRKHKQIAAVMES